MKKGLLTVFLSVIIITGCITQSVNRDIQPKIENIKDNLEKNSITLIEAFVSVQKILLDQNITAELRGECNLFVEFLIDGMLKEFENSVNSGSYDNALKYGLSLSLLNRIERSEVTEAYKGLCSVLENTSDSGYILENILIESIRYRYADRELVDKLFDRLLAAGQTLNYINYYDLLNGSDGIIDAVNPSIKVNVDRNRRNLPATERIDFERINQSVVTIVLDKGFNVVEGQTVFDKSIGTGFFIDDQHILTNYHVIKDHVDPEYKGFSKVTISTRSEPDKNIPVTVVGYDPVYDLALLKTPTRNNPFIVPGTDGSLMIGDKIYTVGTPLGLRYSVTSGIIGGREIEIFELGQALHIDAPVNPGNSGGPLLDENGSIVGVVFAGILQFQGLNFAIPIKYVRETLPSLYHGGRAERSWAGLGVYQDRNDIKVYYIMPFGPAAMADIIDGDTIKRINGIEVKTVEDAQRLISYTRGGGLLKIDIVRDGEERSAIIMTSMRPEIPIEEVFRNDSQTNILKLLFGLNLEYLQNMLIARKYLVKSVIRNVLPEEFSIDEGNQLIVYDLRYIKKDRVIQLNIRFREHEYGIFERNMGVRLPAYISNML